MPSLKCRIYTLRNYKDNADKKCQTHFRQTFAISAIYALQHTQTHTLYKKNKKAFPNTNTQNHYLMGNAFRWLTKYKQPQNSVTFLVYPKLVNDWKTRRIFIHKKSLFSYHTPQLRITLPRFD